MFLKEMKAEALQHMPEGVNGEGRIFRYNPENLHLWENLPRARMIRVSQRGHDAAPIDTPPRRRSIVIALGRQNQIVIAYPYGNTELEGFHDYSESWAIDRLGRLNAWTILHGSVSLSQGQNGKKTRTVYVYEAPREDKSVIQKDGTMLDQGKVDPLKFLSGPDFTAERIMQALCAKELRVVEGIASASFYNLVKSKRQ